MKLSATVATRDDAERLCELARDAHQSSVFSNRPFSEEKFYRHFENTILHPKQFLGAKVTKGGDYIGAIYCSHGPHFISDGPGLVTVTAIFIHSTARQTLLSGKVALKLVGAAKIWGESLDADMVLFHNTSGARMSEVDRFFRKIGASTLGGNYALKI